jgi:hypothetical protein
MLWSVVSHLLPCDGQPVTRDTKENEMTVLAKKAARGVDVRGFAGYLAVGALSIAIGVGVGLGIGGVSEQAFSTPAQQAMAERGASVGAHLDSIWQTGLAQQKAIEDAALLETRFHTGSVQQQAIQATGAPRRAMEIRGAAMDEHLDTLMATGAAVREASEG